MSAHHSHCATDMLVIDWSRSNVMHIALITVYGHPGCTLKDVAGGYGTTFKIGTSLPARWLERAKSTMIHLPVTNLAILAAQFEEAGHEVSVHELRWQAKGRDALPVADAVVLQSSIVDADAECEVLNAYKKRRIPCFVVGAFASAQPDMYAELATAVIQGEAEVLGDKLLDAQGVLDAGFVADLDNLPFASWRAFPRDRYAYAWLSARGATLPIQGSRGCTFGCGYCPFRVTSPFRQRSVDLIRREVSVLVARYGIKGLAFRDPLFNWNRERTLAIADALTPFALNFSGEMRADLLDDQQLTALHRAGLRSLELGIESVDTAMLAQHKRKPPEREQIEYVVRKAKALGIRVIANFMFGLPEDNEANIRATVAYARALKPFAVQFTVATPYPKTTLAQNVKGKLNLLPGEHYNGWNATFAHPLLSPKRLEYLREWAYVSFHLRPAHVVRVLSARLNIQLERFRSDYA